MTELTKLYRRLAKAYQKGRGLRLSSQEVQELVDGDDAVFRVVDQILYPEKQD